MVIQPIWLGLGSNLGNRKANLLDAIARLEARGIGSIRVSSLYETAPIGYLDQPGFLNAVLKAASAAGPEALLEHVAAVETEMGRVRDIPNGPRVIDIDILFYGNHIVFTDTLEIPHPRLMFRRFVLEPLAEISPHLRHPGPERTGTELLARVQDQEVRRIAGPEWLGRKPKLHFLT